MTKQTIVNQTTVPRLAALTLLVMLAACGSGGNQNTGSGSADPVAPDGGGATAPAPSPGPTPSPSPSPAPAPPTPAPPTAELSAPDIGRPTPSTVIDSEVYPIADFYQKMIVQGAHFTLNGQFIADQTTEQRHQVSRTPLASSPTGWLDREDLSRAVVTVDRFENGVASTSDTYADYYSPDRLFVGNRTSGLSTYGLAQGNLSKPVSARVGEHGSIGRIAKRVPGTDSATGHFDVSWEMLQLTDGTPAYCEKTQELNAANQVVFESELCHGLDTNGETTQRVTYGFRSDGASGSLIGSDFALGSSPLAGRPADGALFDQADVTTSQQSTNLDCMQTISGSVPATWNLDGPAPTTRQFGRFNETVSVWQGQVFMTGQWQASESEEFRWDAFDRVYVGTNRYVDDNSPATATSKFGRDLHLSYFKRDAFLPDQTISLECYDGIIPKVALPSNGPTSNMMCSGELPYRPDTRAMTIEAAGGRLLTKYSNLSGWRDLFLYDTHSFWPLGDQLLISRKLETLDDGWYRWTSKRRVFGQPNEAFDTLFEFDEQWNFRRFEGSSSNEAFQCLRN